jgi:hypothetical protein
MGSKPTIKPDDWRPQPKILHCRCEPPKPVRYRDDDGVLRCFKCGKVARQ